MNQEQQRVFDWLNSDLNLPVFAEAYRGAISLLSQKSSGYITFIAHTGRDLMNGLASTVAGIKSERVQYQQHIDSLCNVWEDTWRIGEHLLATESSEETHVIPAEICQKISNLILEHKSGRLRSSDADGLFFSTFLDYSDRDKIPNNFISEWKSAKNWFLKKAHLREKPFELNDDDELIKHFNCLDGYLQIAASSQYDRLKELNEILDATNQ